MAVMAMGKLEKLVLVSGALILAASLGTRYFRDKPKSRFTDNQQEWFDDHNVSLDRAEKYNDRFMLEEVRLLDRANVPSHIADLYDARFNGRDIASFVEHKISPEVAKGYLHNRLEGWVSYLAENGILPEVALEYDVRFDGKDILELAKERSQPERSGFAESNFAVHKGIPAKVANAYHKNFKVYEIIRLQNEGIGPAEANEYVEAYSKFDAADIGKFHLNTVPAKEAGKFAGLFDERFNHWDIVEQVRTLFTNNVSFEEAQKLFELNKKYGVNIGANDIVYFKKTNVPFEEVEKEAKRYMFDKVFER